MMTMTYLMRHAPSQYSVAYRLNGDPTIIVPLTPEGEAACAKARQTFCGESLAACVASEFGRCRDTARLLVDGQIDVQVNRDLNEVQYGDFEGAEFLTYARWLADHGPYEKPPGAHESQSDAIRRTLNGLRRVLALPGPRLVIAHGLLVSVVQWALAHPRQPMIDVFLPAAACLKPLIVPDTELTDVMTWFEQDCETANRSRRCWRVDLGVFPPRAREALATVTRHSSYNDRTRP